MWRTNLKVIAVVLGTLGLYTLIANKIPQIQSEVPQSLSFGANVTTEQLVAAGDKLFNGAGGCTACHGLGTRAPNLLTDEKGAGPIGARCGKRESGRTCKQYLFESLDAPAAYVVSGYQPIMPRMTAQLSPPQIWSLIAFLELQGGGLAGGSTDPKTIIQAAGCLGCHTLDGQGGRIAPDLTHVGARRSTESIRKKILDPMSSIAKGYEKLAGVMPKSFGSMLTGAQFEALVQYLGAHK